MYPVTMPILTALFKPGRIAQFQNLLHFFQVSSFQASDFVTPLTLTKRAKGFHPSSNQPLSHTAAIL